MEGGRLKITIQVDTELSIGSVSVCEAGQNTSEFELFAQLALQAVRGAASAVGFAPELVQQLEWKEDAE